MPKNPAAVALGKKGGKKRWEGKTDAEKKEHAMRMVAARRSKSLSEQTCTSP